MLTRKDYDKEIEARDYAITELVKACFALQDRIKILETRCKHDSSVTLGTPALSSHWHHGNNAYRRQLLTQKHVSTFGITA
jgi:hypothetical protein